MSEQIDTALRWAAARIASCSETPRLDAELLLSHCLEKPRSYLYSWPEQSLAEECWRRFSALVERRAAPTPVAYLLGEREFYSLQFATRPVALVPRPETELLVELALAQIPADRPFRILDLGTGTGIVAITLQTHRPQARVCATDLDPRCLELAGQNAARHGVTIELIESDWYERIPRQRRFDLIVSNPPYIAADHPFLAAGDLPAEPRLALTPGKTGLEALESIIAGAPAFLEPGGRLVVEHGYDQQAAVELLFAASGFSDIECASDLNDLPRATRGQLG